DQVPRARQDAAERLPDAGRCARARPGADRRSAAAPGGDWRDRGRLGQSIEQVLAGGRKEVTRRVFDVAWRFGQHGPNEVRELLLSLGTVCEGRDERAGAIETRLLRRILHRVAESIDLLLDER